MNKSDIEDTKQAVENLHNCKASFIEDVVVMEKFQDQTVWDGIVHVFKMEGNPKSDTCYA